MDSSSTRHCPTCGSSRPGSVRTSPGARAPIQPPSDISILDGRIAMLRNELAEVSRQRNSLLPVARVPEEILVEIFLHARVDACEYHAFSKVSYVWRYAALSCARLWTIMHLSSPNRSIEMLRRSRSTGIHICADILSSNVTRLPSLLLEELCSSAAHRIASIEIRNGLPALPPILEQLVVASAPSITSLSLTTACDRFATPTVSIMTAHYPSLQILKLTAQPLDWSSTLVASCSSLRVLELRFSSTIVTQTPEQLHAAFSSLQRLETLVLERSIPCRSWRGSNATLAVMPMLRNVRLVDNPSACLTLLRLLAVPDTCQTDITAYSDSDTEVGVEEGLLRLLVTPSSHRITIAPSDDDDGTVCIELSIHTILDTSGPPHYRLLFATANGMQILSALLSTLPSSAVLAIDIAQIESVHVDMWQALCATASSHTVSLQDSGLHAHAMSIDLLKATNWLGILPDMRILVLEAFDVGMIQSVDLLELLETLAERQAANILEELHFLKCTNFPKDASTIESWRAILGGIQVIECT